MRNDGVLAYGIDGRKDQELRLTGATSAIGMFTAACKGGAAAAGQVADGLARDVTARSTGASVASSLIAAASAAPESTKAESVSCAEFGKIKSVRSDSPAKMTFVNSSDGYRGILWIDTEGTPIDNTGLNQGETATVPTFETHAWMITDGPGNCIEMVVAGEGDTTFEITAPAPVLGPEND